MVASEKKHGGSIIEQSANVYETYDAQRTVAAPVLQVLANDQSKLLRFENPNTGVLTGDLAEGWELPGRNDDRAAYAQRGQLAQPRPWG